MKRLDGGICLVTGASRGIGAGIEIGLGETRAVVDVPDRATSGA